MFPEFDILRDGRNDIWIIQNDNHNPKNESGTQKTIFWCRRTDLQVKLITILVSILFLQLPYYKVYLYNAGTIWDFKKILILMCNYCYSYVLITTSPQLIKFNFFTRCPKKIHQVSWIQLMDRQVKQRLGNWKLAACSKKIFARNLLLCAYR